jgi:sugar phosphate isomerase/epimerase
MREFACSTLPFDGYDLDEAFSGIAAIGFEAVEIAFIEGYTNEFSDELFNQKSALRTRKLLGAAGLRCSAVAGHIDLSEATAVERMTRRIQFCSEIGASRVITNAARISRGMEFFSNIEKLIPLVEQANVSICLENPGNGVENVVNDGASAVAAIKRISHPLFRINYDFANTLSHFPDRFPAETDFEQTLPWLAQVHLKDVKRGVNNNFFFTALGEGMIDFRTIFATLLEARSTATICLELPLRLRRREDGSPYRREGPIALKEISAILSRSRDFVTSGLSKSVLESKSNGESHAAKPPDIEA